MPPKRRTRPSVAPRNGSGPPPAGRPGGGNVGLPPLPATFAGAVEQLVELVRTVTDDSVTMFKLEVANVPDSQDASEVAASLSAKEQRGICAVAPLCEVRLSDLPGNGCSALFDQRQYAEALLHAVRAHFAFVELDRRLIYTSTAGVRDPTATSQLLYVFSYVNTASGRPEATGDRTAAKIPDAREAAHRRRTVAVVPRLEDDDVDMAETSIGDELERYRDRLDRVERNLLEASQSIADQDLRLPEAKLDSSLQDVPAPALGTALHAVLPRVQASVPEKRPAAKRKPPRGIISHPDTVAAAAATAAAATKATAAAPAASRTAPATGGRGRRRRSLSPTPTAPDSGDSAAPEPAAPAGPPTPSRQAAGNLPAAEADQLVAFFQKLNGSQTEQSRVSLTCRYAKMRYGHDVSSGVVYRLIESARRRGGGGAAAAAGPEPLTEEGRRQTALAVFGELDTGHSEQSRVAYTLQYMRVQHAVKLDANTLFGWLGQGAKKPQKPGAKRARVR